MLLDDDSKLYAWQLEGDSYQVRVLFVSDILDQHIGAQERKMGPRVDQSPSSQALHSGRAGVRFMPLSALYGLSRLSVVLNSVRYRDLIYRSLSIN